LAKNYIAYSIYVINLCGNNTDSLLLVCQGTFISDPKILQLWEKGVKRIKIKVYF
jgi:hypothetical protein